MIRLSTRWRNVRYGTNAKYRLALKLSAYRGRPEVIGPQSE